MQLTRGIDLEVKKKDLKKSKEILGSLIESTSISYDASENIAAVCSFVAWLIYCVGGTFIFMGLTFGWSRVVIGICIIILGIIISAFGKSKKNKTAQTANN